MWTYRTKINNPKWILWEVCVFTCDIALVNEDVLQKSKTTGIEVLNNTSMKKNPSITWVMDIIPVQLFAAFEVPDSELSNLNPDAYLHLLNLRQDCNLHPLLYHYPNLLLELALKKIFVTFNSIVNFSSFTNARF